MPSAQYSLSTPASSLKPTDFMGTASPYWQNTSAFSSGTLAGLGEFIDQTGETGDRLMRLTKDLAGANTFKAERYVPQSLGYLLRGGVVTGERGWTGIVQSAEWASRFKVIADFSEKADGPLIFVAFAANLLQRAPELADVARKKEPVWQKAIDFARITQKATADTIGGVITGPFDLVLQVVQGLCGLTGSAACSNTLQKWRGNLDSFVNSKVEQVMDTGAPYFGFNPLAGPITVTIQFLATASSSTGTGASGQRGH